MDSIGATTPLQERSTALDRSPVRFITCSPPTTFLPCIGFSDEQWHFYAGGSLLIEAITPTGELLSLKLGLDIEAEEQPQHLVPAGCWFGATVHRGEYVLAGCTVTPAFDFAEFELADRVELLNRYPQHAAMIKKLTHHA